MRALIVALAITASSVELVAQEISEPIPYTWIATTCETWDCAATAFILAKGDPNTIVLPTSNPKRPWLILRKVEEGSIYIPEDEPFTCTTFAHMSEASLHFNSLESCRSPLLLNTLDGKALVMSMARCDPPARQRAVGH